MAHCFHVIYGHTRADVKLHLTIVIAIFELPSVHTGERRLLWVCGLAFQSGEKECGSFLCSSEMLIAISFKIEFLLENVRVYRQKLSEGHAVQRSRHSCSNFAAWFERCVTGIHRRTIISIAEFSLAFVMLICYTRAKIPSFEWSFKLRTLLLCENPLYLHK